MSEREERILAAAMERILPGGRGPGARDAGAVGYVAWVSRQESFGPHASCLWAGLALVESLARAMWGRPFEACRSDEQDSVLRTVQGAPHPTAQRFFAMLVRLTLAGFLCAPEHGGNRDAVGWRYVGFTPDAVPVREP